MMYGNKQNMQTDIISYTDQLSFKFKNFAAPSSFYWAITYKLLLLAMT